MRSVLHRKCWKVNTTYLLMNFSITVFFGATSLAVVPHMLTKVGNIYKHKLPSIYIKVQLSSKADLAFETVKTETGRILEIPLKQLLSETPFTPCHIPLRVGSCRHPPLLPQRCSGLEWDRVHSQLMLKHSLNPQNQKFFRRCPEGISPPCFLGSPTDQLSIYLRRKGTHHREKHWWNGIS